MGLAALHGLFREGSIDHICSSRLQTASAAPLCQMNARILAGLMCSYNQLARKHWPARMREHTNKLTNRCGTAETMNPSDVLAYASRQIQTNCLTSVVWADPYFELLNSNHIIHWTHIMQNLLPVRCPFFLLISLSMNPVYSMSVSVVFNLSQYKADVFVTFPNT